MATAVFSNGYCMATVWLMHGYFMANVCLSQVQGIGSRSILSIGAQTHDYTIVCINR